MSRLKGIFPPGRWTLNKKKYLEYWECTEFERSWEVRVYESREMLENAKQEGDD